MPRGTTGKDKRKISKRRQSKLINHKREKDKKKRGKTNLHQKQPYNKRIETKIWPLTCGRRSHVVASSSTTTSTTGTTASSSSSTSHYVWSLGRLFFVAKWLETTQRNSVCPIILVARTFCQIDLQYSSQFHSSPLHTAGILYATPPELPRLTISI